jgi:hypothetical protein
MARVGFGRRVAPPAGVIAALIMASATAGCGTPSVAAGRPQVSGSQPGRAASPEAARARQTASLRSTSAGLPQYFADIVRFSGSVTGAGPVQIRSTATGDLVRTQPGIAALAIAAYDGGSRLLIAQQAGEGCSSRLYRAALNARGRLGRLTRLGPAVRGIVTSVATDAGGSLIGYFAWPCSKSASGYLAVLTAGSGQVRRWTGVAVDGSTGTVAAGGVLAMSADGNLLAFSGMAVSASERLLGLRVWTLSATAPPGPLAARSRAVLKRPESAPEFSAVALSPDGESFYVCTVASTGTVSARRTITQTAVITARRTANGTSAGAVAKLTAAGVTFAGESFGCPMAMTPNGQYLLAPYQLRYGNSSSVPPLVVAAVISTSSDASKALSFRLPGSAGMSVVTGVSIAW